MGRNCIRTNVESDTGGNLISVLARCSCAVRPEATNARPRKKKKMRQEKFQRSRNNSLNEVRECETKTKRMCGLRGYAPQRNQTVLVWFGLSPAAPVRFLLVSCLPFLVLILCRPPSQAIFARTALCSNISSLLPKMARAEGSTPRGKMLSSPSARSLSLRSAHISLVLSCGLPMASSSF